MPSKILITLVIALIFSFRGLGQNQSQAVPSVVPYEPISVQFGKTSFNKWEREKIIRGPETEIGPTSVSVGSSNTIIIKQREILALMQDLQTYRQISVKMPQSTTRRPPGNTPEKMAGFNSALAVLEGMLKGRYKMSVADAFYAVEEAYGSVHLSKEQYNNIIKESADFIKKWIVQNGLDLNDSFIVQYAIQKFMSERLSINKIRKTADKSLKMEIVIHQPFRYDYDDYAGLKDYRNLFLTKCLATGYGQCSSMPAVYLVLAEALGVKAYLSFAPHHSFIKYLDNNRNIVNYEPTSNWEISDKWYKDNLFISTEAVTSGIYLDTLNSQQIIANCVFDLALEYVNVDRSGDEQFILDCLSIGVPQFSRNNNLSSLFIYSMHLKTMLLKEMSQNNIHDLDEIKKYPLTQEYYKEYLQTEEYILKLGYREMPEGVYEGLLKQQEFRSQVQHHFNISGKVKKNMFIKSK
ncbi:Transglutaminase-like superfamily protein [Chitinophaga sp. YR627]|uniref:hypothetical protein n=1 Tax=Chitinophaga sp. YR627 TaxID=1881041 RepID=UPI0008F20FD8|nr:hypothetical protein [Chitinophaga sp. YR627]SFO74855.1 Transglutaminase-like superfamily protein [Chitinophaga sp. YR627]